MLEGPFPESLLLRSGQPVAADGRVGGQATQQHPRVVGLAGQRCGRASSRRWPATPSHTARESVRAADRARQSRRRSRSCAGGWQRLHEIEEHHQPPAVPREELPHERRGPRHRLADELFPQRRQVSGRCPPARGRCARRWPAHTPRTATPRRGGASGSGPARLRGSGGSSRRGPTPPCHNSSARGSRSISANRPRSGISRSKTTWVQIAGPNASGSSSVGTSITTVSPALRREPPRRRRRGPSRRATPARRARAVRRRAPPTLPATLQHARADGFHGVAETVAGRAVGGLRQRQRRRRRHAAGSGLDAERQIESGLHAGDRGVRSPRRGRRLVAALEQEARRRGPFHLRRHAQLGQRPAPARHRQRRPARRARRSGPAAGRPTPSTIAAAATARSSHRGRVRQPPGAFMPIPRERTPCGSEAQRASGRGDLALAAVATAGHGDRRRLVGWRRAYSARSATIGSTFVARRAGR